MAIAAGLLPWTVAETDAGIIACMQRWAKQRGNIDTAGELLRALPDILRAVDEALDNRFIHIRKGKRGWEPATEADKIRQQTPDAFDGYVKPDRILIRPAAWSRLCNGFDPTEIARHFQRQGVLITDENSGKLSKSEQVIGGSERFYILSRTPPDTPDTMTPENRTDPP